MTCPSRFAKDEEHLLEKVKESLDVHGYAIVEKFISNERADQMKAELLGILDRVPEGRNDFEGFLTKRIYAVFAKTRSFDDLATDPLVLGVMESALGSSEILLSSPTGIYIEPGEKEQMLHRDDGKYPIPIPHGELIMNSMWAFDDFTSENGSTVLYPGSHKFNEKELEEVSEGVRTKNTKHQRILAQMPKGSVMFYRGSLLHGGGANKTDKARLGVILEYCCGWLRPQENHILAIPPEVMRTLPDRLIELLGYSVARPFIGYVDGRHPKRLLENEKFSFTSRNAPPSNL